MLGFLLAACANEAAGNNVNAAASSNPTCRRDNWAIISISPQG
jgi:hypothetical protein